MATKDQATRRLDKSILAQLRPFWLFEKIPVTRPTLPPLDEYHSVLKEIWDTRWLTNNGVLHQRLEQALGELLDVSDVNLFCNGTIALLVGLQALGIEGGEVITTPFTFPATSHALHWNRVTPVFGDITAETFNLDPRNLPALITKRTRAILPVHVYGIPCDVDGIEACAAERGIPVIYDAAHTMGVRFRGRHLAAYGDMSVLSFHATKIFTTGEGGALVSHFPYQAEQVRFLRNFGIASEEDVLLPGINGKMNELQAGLGLLHLTLLEEEIARRRSIACRYMTLLANVPGVSYPKPDSQTEPNFAYFPIIIDPVEFGWTRDELSEALKSINAYPRKYFYPLCSRYPCYHELPSAAPEKLPVAERIASRVLCLPVYGDLPIEAVEHICAAIQTLHDYRAHA